MFMFDKFLSCMRFQEEFYFSSNFFGIYLQKMRGQSKTDKLLLIYFHKKMDKTLIREFENVIW